MSTNTTTPTKVTDTWKIVDSVPPRRSAETNDAIQFFKEMIVGKTVHIDAPSESIAKRAAAILKKESEHIQIKFRSADPAEGGGVYATKVSG